MVPPVIVLVGPTAAGKSSVALALAERVGGEIIAADSMQVYRGLDIGTAKPSIEQRQRVPHHLIDLVEPDQPFTAADFARFARAAIADIRGRGHPPIIVGGTGLYIRAVIRGLFDGPGEQASLREGLRHEAARVGVPALHRRLQDLDPEAAAVIHPNDLFRIVRALEVWAVLGRPIALLRAEGRRNQQEIPGPLLWFGLTRHRQELNQRIATRLEQMMARGFLDEVQGLLDRGYSPALKPFRAIGYRHLIEHLTGRTSLNDALGHLARDTRRYAKRQLTWFRHEPWVEWHVAEGPDFIERVLASFIKRIEEV